MAKFLAVMVLTDHLFRRICHVQWYDKTVKSQRIGIKLCVRYIIKNYQLFTQLFRRCKNLW